MWTWLLFPVALLALFVLTTAVSMLLSVLYVRFRDVAIIWAVVDPGPLLRDPGPLPDHDRAREVPGLLFVNPLAPIFEQVRVWVIDPNAPTASDVAGGAVHLLPAVAIFVGVCVLGVWIFNRDAPRIAEEL